MGNDIYKYGRYLNHNQETRWATVEEIQNSGTYVDLFSDKYPTAGLPLLSNGKEAYVDGKDTHSLIFGATGSKKTRLICMPLVNMMVKAGESFIVTDPKGELYERTSGIAAANGYNLVVLNFRDIGKGDMWNPISMPYDLYNSGNKEAAISMLNDFVATIAAHQIETQADPFWGEMASSYALANLLLLMECATKEEANVSSLAVLCTSSNEAPLQKLASFMSEETIAGLNYKGVFVGAERTRQSIYISLYGMVRIFNIQKNLSRMLSGNTIDIKRFGREKTAVYIIVPDEKTTYHFLVTTFIKQVYEILISEAQQEKNRKLPVRVNFVLDEFCNIPKIPDMPSMISAARSREMRFFLVAQSQHQLVSKYGEDSETIKGNCDNWIFLTSKEISLLNEISELCGSLYTNDKRLRRLISVSELQRLDKEKGEALIMHARQYPIITELADIDDYKSFKGYDSVEMKNFKIPNAPIFSVQDLLDDVLKNGRIAPFSPKALRLERKEEEGKNTDDSSLDWLESELKGFSDLFGDKKDSD